MEEEFLLITTLVGNNTQLETTDLTYSVDVMYNDTLFVNISAHNCAGYRDLISLTLKYVPGRESILYLTPNR